LAENDKVSRAKKRRTAFETYYAPVMDEIVEVQQAAKCRTSPIFKRDASGKETTEVDKSRTNVCMPTVSIGLRKNVARMTANPPKLDFISQKNPDVAEKLSALRFMSFDKTNEADVQRKHVMQAEMCGLSVTKIYWDAPVERRTFRVKTANATRTQLMTKNGRPEEEIKQAVGEFGDVPTPDETGAAVEQFGTEFSMEQDIKRYAGPCTKFVFLGDFRWTPGVPQIDDADWTQEDYVESETWLEYWLDKTYSDPETGEQIPVMDRKVVTEMIDADKDLPQRDKDTLRDRFLANSKLDAVDKPTGAISMKELRCGKKFAITEEHELREDGKWWINFIGNDEFFLGQMPYPGISTDGIAIRNLVPLPDLVSAFGDSTPRLGRFLHRLDNVTTGLTTDLVIRALRPITFTGPGVDIADEDFIAHNAFDEVRVKNLSQVKVEQLARVPAEAWEQQAFIMRRQAQLEPSLASADMAGTNSNPQSGKTATVGVLAQRERDALLEFKVTAVNIYSKKVNQKKLQILKRTLQGPIEIGEKYVSQNMKYKQLNQQDDPEAISMRSGKASVITLDWPEIQDDIQVEPVIGSTLAMDDEFHRMAAQTFYQAAMADPETLNKQYAATVYVRTLKGVDPGQAVLPPPPPPDPLSSVKMSLSVNMPLDKMPADVTNQALVKLGFTPSAELQHRDTVQGIIQVGEAADGAAKLAEPVGGSEAEAGTEASTRKTAADRV
jgi:hypothetical protein